MIEVHSESCRAMHLGVWAIEPNWFREAVSAVKSGVWAAAKRGEPSEGPGYSTTADGVAIVRLLGPLMKGWSKYGGTSTIDARRQLRAAAVDKKVKGVLLAIDSPGGTAAGTAELADEVQAAGRAKPLHAFIEDTGASAAYWAASQAGRITANRGAMVGSIGTMAVLYDVSKAAEKQGVEPVVFTTGPYKAMGVEGAAITAEQREYWQGVVDKLNEGFLDAVSRGRGFGKEGLDAVSDGRVWVGKDAQALGLIDGVGSFDDAMNGLLAAVEKAGETPRRNSVEVRNRLG